jgi:hypothetical protein
MNWIDLAQDRDQWRALVNTVLKHRDKFNFYLYKKIKGEFITITNIKR